MICFATHRPALLVGHDHQVIDYGTDWLQQALNRASKAAGHDNLPFADDITKGIVDFLENHCPLNLLPLQDLYRKLQSTLEKLGRKDVARQLTVLAPPLEVSLTELLEQQTTPHEILFFEALRLKTENLKLAGAENLSFPDLRPTVLKLVGTKRWTKSCAQLEDQILSYA